MILSSNEILSADEDKPYGQEDDTSNDISNIAIQSKIVEKKRRSYRLPHIKINRNVIYASGAAISVILIIFLVWFFFFKTHSENLTAERGTWERKIAVESFAPRDRSGWSYPPSDAYNVDRDYRYHYSREVFSHYDISTYNCGTYSEPRTCTRQKAVYRSEPVYDWYYSYTVDRWAFDRWIVTSGDKNSVPSWADLSAYTFVDSEVIGNERLSGKREEDYDVYLRNEKGEEKHLDVDQKIWTNIQIGAIYKAEVNHVGTVRSVNWDI